MTALDILVRSKRDARDSEIEESLKRALKANDDVDHKHKNIEHQDEWLERKKGSLMVAASLIATMAFQVGVNPPGGLWQDDKIVNSTDTSADSYPNGPNHLAGFSILVQNYPDEYTHFYAINTIGFTASLSIILLLMSGLPLRRRFFMWFLMVITWISVTAITLIYMESVRFLIPSFPAWSMTRLGLLIWIGLMTLLVFANTARSIVKLLKNLRQRWRKTNHWRVSRLV